METVTRSGFNDREAKDETVTPYAPFRTPVVTTVRPKRTVRQLEREPVRNPASSAALLGLRPDAVEELVDQSMGSFPVGSIACRGLAYEILNRHPELINFSRAAHRDPRCQNL